MEFMVTLALFALVSSITPGPNNLMLMSSGATFGLLRTLPHMLGVALGFCFMLFLVGVGVIQLFDAFPFTYEILKWFSVLYLTYLAVKIARSGKPRDSKQDTAKPFTFFQAALFQWVNPKAWTMALSAISLYAPERNVESVFLVTLVFGLVNFPSVSVWAWMGQSLQRLLTSPIKLTAFNYLMAGLLLVSIYPVVMG